MIEIINYQKVNKNKVIGLVDIKIPNWNNMIIRKIAHIQSGDRRWFNLPSFSREKKDGTPEYLKYWQFELEIHNSQLLELLTEKVKEFCEKHNIIESTPLDFATSLMDSIENLPF